MSGPQMRRRVTGIVPQDPGLTNCHNVFPTLAQISSQAFARVVVRAVKADREKNDDGGFWETERWMNFRLEQKLAFPDLIIQR